MIHAVYRQNELCIYRDKLGNVWILYLLIGRPIFCSWPFWAIPSCLFFFIFFVPFLKRRLWCLLFFVNLGQRKNWKRSYLGIFFKIRIGHRIVDVCLCCCRTNWCIL